MKTAKKALLVTMCALVLVAATVMGTLAYLTSQDEVENTFAIGHLFIQLDEADTDELGNVINETRVKSNDYKLMPGQAYTKDPTVTVMNGSDACFVYVTVENQLAGLIGDLEDQIVTANGWTKFADKNGATVYYKAVDAVAATDAALKLPVFGNFEVNKDVENLELSEYEGAKINVKAYAIQQLNVGTAEEAWNNNFAE